MDRRSFLGIIPAAFATQQLAPKLTAAPPGPHVSIRGAYVRDKVPADAYFTFTHDGREITIPAVNDATGSYFAYGALPDPLIVYGGETVQLRLNGSNYSPIPLVDWPSGPLPQPWTLLIG